MWEYRRHTQSFGGFEYEENLFVFGYLLFTGIPIFYAAIIRADGLGNRDASGNRGPELQTGGIFRA